MKEGAVAEMRSNSPAAAVAAMDRKTICFPRFGSHEVANCGDDGFHETIAKFYDTPENNALEQVVQLKTRLGGASADTFWTVLCEGLCNITGAELSFVMKRVLVDEKDTAVEMPPHGQPGSCMMSAALHFRASDGTTHHERDTKYLVYGCPCAYMRHDKVFVIPERFNEFITENPNTLPVNAEAYIAAPLFANSKSFAHFGVLWSVEAAAKLRLSWAFLEMILHSLEDVVQRALLAPAHGFPMSSERDRVIPHDAVGAGNSLRPYAGSLSHELRTPMQGIVGMLDVMYSTVLEATKGLQDLRLRSVFRDLKEGIEVVQDSSRRAVEAADNVVHAYDMDMSVPDEPASIRSEEPSSMSPFTRTPVDKVPEILVAGHNLPIARPNKRRRDDAFPRSGSEDASSLKIQRVNSAVASWPRRSEPSVDILKGIEEAGKVQLHARPGAIPTDLPTSEDVELAASAVHPSSRTIAPGLRHTNLREVFRHVIDEGLKVGGRPDQFLATETALGESIQVRSRGSDGSVKTKTIIWRVDANMPTSLFIDEKDLSKLISCVFRNAIKFTDQDGGHVGIFARMSSRTRYISITITDNGPGIPAAFLPKLFRAFSRDDQSITRSSEGLGLGLMVAKGIARKLGGDLVCTSSETSGPNHGSEFEIKVPIKAGETITRPSSPFSSPRIGHVKPAALNIPSTPPLPPPHDLLSLHDDTHGHSDRITNGGTPSQNGAPKTPTSTNSSPRLSTTPPPEAKECTRPSWPPASCPEATPPQRPRIRKSVSNPHIDPTLAIKYPLTFLVAEDNKINRKLLVSMLRRLGYKAIHEAHDGAEAVRQMAMPRPAREQIDVVLMDLWMPLMDGYEATERILGTGRSSSSSASPPVSPTTAPGQLDGLTALDAKNTSSQNGHLNDSAVSSEHNAALTETCAPPRIPTVLAVTADCTSGALERAAQVGMRGFMTKPYKLHDLQRLITEYCASNAGVTVQ